MTRTRTAVIVATVIAATITGVEATAGAPSDKTCLIDEVTLELECTNDYQAPGESATPAGTGGSGGTTSVGVWSREMFGVSVAEQLGTDVPVLSPECQTDDGEEGLLFRDTMRDPETGEILYEEESCVPVDPDGPDPALAEPPAPPTLEELADIAAFPELEVTAYPANRGMTGMESRFWVPGPGDVTAATGELRGWTVSGSVSAVNWVWETGDGGRYVTQDSGSAAEPAVRHIYERLPEADGDEETTWPVEVEVTWKGDWSISGYGVEFVVDDLSTVTVGSLDYEIIEAVGVLHEDERGS